MSQSLQRELRSTFSGRNTKLIYEGWIDHQLDLNHQVTRIQLRQQPVCSEIKVMQTFHRRLSLHRLLDTLGTTENTVERLALVGLRVDALYAKKLAHALVGPGGGTCTIRSLQVCRLLPDGLQALLAFSSSSLLSSVSSSSSSFSSSNPFEGLQELRLTFHHDIPVPLIVQLLNALQQSTTLEILKIYRLDLDQPDHPQVMQALQDLVTKAPKLVDLRLTACHLHNVGPLATAIRSTNRLQQLDWSMNQISDPQALVVLLQTPSLRSVCLSQNLLNSWRGGTGGNSLDSAGDDGAVATVTRSSANDLKEALARNTTLERLFLDMNPLQGILQALWEALENDNTSLKRLGFLTTTAATTTVPNQEMALRHVVALNEAGRGLVRHSKKNDAAALLLPYMLARVNREPALVMGLLQEDPNVWMSSSFSSLR